MQRDAMRNGRAAGPQHRGRGRSSQGRERPRAAQRRSATSRSRSPTTRRCPRPRPCCTTPGRATCSAAALLLHAEGRHARRALVLGAGPERRRAERLLLHRPRRPRSPVLAHEFLNFMLDEKNAYDNFVNFIGYTPPQNGIDAETLIKQRPDPEVARAGGRPAGPVRGQPGAAAAERRGPAALGQRLVEVQGGLMRSRWIWRAAGAARASSGSRSSSWSPSTRSSPSRSATRTRCRSRSRSGTRWTGTSATCSTMLRNIWHGGPFLTVSLRTIAFVAIAMALSLLIGYPVAYYTARHAGRWKGARPARADPAVLDQLPDADAGVDQPALARTGWATRFLHDTRHRVAVPHARPACRARAAGSTGSRRRSILALVYGYIPFLILPLFAALDRIDQRQIEAARDLGASPRSAFLRVTLPLSVPGHPRRRAC